MKEKIDIKYKVISESTLTKLENTINLIASKGYEVNQFVHQVYSGVGWQGIVIMKKINPLKE